MLIQPFINVWPYAFVVKHKQYIPVTIQMQVCVGTKNNLGTDFKFQTKSKDDIHVCKALSLCHGYSR